MQQGRIVSTSPQYPGDVVASLAAATPDQVNAAFKTARLVGQSWSRMPSPERAGALQRAAQGVADAASELAELITREVGKPISEARGEVVRAERILHYYAQLAYESDGETYPSAGAGHLLFSRRRPHGVAGLITPWNFPVAIPVWKAAPALAVGNSVVLKPAPEASSTGLRLGEILQESLPAGVVHVLVGGAQVGVAVVDGADVVSFTGSSVVGREVQVRCADRGVSAQCEMGGLNAAIVMPDADTVAAARMIANAIAGYAGQKCTATRRVVVVGSPDAFAEALRNEVERLPLGDPADPGTVVGPVITERARQRISDAVAATVASGGELMTRGDLPTGAGWFVRPALVIGAPDDAVLNQEEVFGPVCTVTSAATLSDAIDLANAVPYGLVGSVHTQSLSAAIEVAERLETGLVRVNEGTTGVDFHAPFGGMKASSFGPREQGKAALDFFSKTVTVTISPG